jgi:peptidoglycan hydrolase-like protein with peptidoglycan-binding domain
MVKKIIKLTEADLTNLVKRVIKEQNELGGQEVQELQTALNSYFKQKKVGVNGKLYQIPVDSQWGKQTIDALKKFQTMEKINPDGIPGPDTYRALHSLGLDQDIIDKAIAWIGKLF